MNTATGETEMKTDDLDIYVEMYRRVAFCLSHALWKMGWTVQELADESGLEYGLIRDILCGQKDVTLMEIAQMECALGHEIMRISFSPHEGARRKRRSPTAPIESPEADSTPQEGDVNR